MAVVDVGIKFFFDLWMHFSWFVAFVSWEFVHFVKWAVHLVITIVLVEVVCLRPCMADCDCSQIAGSLRDRRLWLYWNCNSVKKDVQIINGDEHRRRKRQNSWQKLLQVSHNNAYKWIAACRVYGSKIDTMQRIMRKQKNYLIASILLGVDGSPSWTAVIRR